jgi:hypothetical protein
VKRTLLFAATAALISVVPASWGEDQVTICHFPPGDPANVQVITIGSSAVPAHIENHGDVIFDGACGTHVPH